MSNRGRKVEASQQTLSAVKLCEMTGLTDRRHRQLAAAGYFPSPINGEYQYEQTIVGMFRHFRDVTARVRASMDDEKREKLKSEKKLIEARLSEQNLANEREAGGLIALEAAQSVAARAAFAIRQKILASRLTQQEKQGLLIEINALGETDFSSAEDALAEDDIDEPETKQPAG